MSDAHAVCIEGPGRRFGEIEAGLGILGGGTGGPVSSRRRLPRALWKRRCAPAWLAIAAACALTAAAAAQTGSAPRADAPEASATEPQPPPAGPRGSAPVAPPGAETTQPAKPETERANGPAGHFDPSERVPAGSSVSFPVDI
jgi:hypothetical protein